MHSLKTAQNVHYIRHAIFLSFFFLLFFHSTLFRIYFMFWLFDCKLVHVVMYVQYPVFSNNPLLTVRNYTFNYQIKHQLCVFFIHMILSYWLRRPLTDIRPFLDYCFPCKARTYMTIISANIFIPQSLALEIVYLPLWVASDFTGWIKSIIYLSLVCWINHVIWLFEIGEMILAMPAYCSIVFWKMPALTRLLVDSFLKDVRCPG